MASSRLQQLSDHGQSVWIDFVSRELIREGGLQRMIDEDAVVGVTSNPTIFQKAISHGSDYDDQIRACLEEVEDPKEIFWRLAETDIRDACDVLRPVWDQGSGRDGYVSLEVDPNLAYERKAQYDEAKHLHAVVDRPNLLVKIPGTEPGLGAIEDSIAEGRSINVTLIFSLDRYEQVAEAYVR